MTLLQITKRIFILLDIRFELLDVLGTAFSESGLRLSVALLSLFRRCINLVMSQKLLDKDTRM